MSEYFLQERSRVKRFRELADEEKQAGIQGQWHQESPAREYLEQVKGCHDTDCNEPMMKKGLALKKKKEIGKNIKTFSEKKMKASEEAEKVSIVQEIMLKSTDYLRRIIAPVGGHGRVTMSYLCPHCNSFPSEEYVWWVSGRKHTKWWCAICGEKHDWKQRNRACAQI